MGDNKTPRIAIAVPPQYRNHLEEMAKESAMTIGGLMSSLLMSVVDDDRSTHGRPPISRDGYSANQRTGRL